MKRKNITDYIEKGSMDDFKFFLNVQKKKKGLGAFVSSHEILGVLTEEFDELKDAVRDNDTAQLKMELLDIMIGAFWGICSIEQSTLDW